ncbi:ABC transporter substrate-binding protein [Actinoplanes sp. NBRC 14428]|uniref:Carbohydrate ABC transporter substrate-binding protein (CUT1 family) n=1 Tax=Pseudosporangium ferrugineum TaxID=439699 RepID=A0A2T0SIG6_9ACTN|nr:ABC transporter substrate-binding protein [Pseudosporangium ferrugineum]PRY33208.1 carbohydrate ABC transporter substrate-binding protein (CUT1 family) [Pseudosporangium ferrugineum]BCJ48798.1 ABC transporter substrate-binding protein [Actinoplanes sp. NBRC 14428]
MTHRSGPISRRALLAGIAAAPVLGACGGVSTTGSGGGAGSITLMSNQFSPVEEKQRFERILQERVTGEKVAFNQVETGIFASTLQTQADAGKVRISVAGALHGDLAPHASRLTDLDDVLASLSDRGFAEELTGLAKLGGSTTKYIPWMQASYVLAVHKKALQWLPPGADVQRLTYDQLLTWTTAARQANGGKPVFGIPAGVKGLYHRFFQGFLLPSFTGGQITTFRGPDAVTAWEYMKQLWAQTARASTTYDNLQEPLQRGEVLIGFDHVARLVGAPAGRPDDWLMVPAPSGPKGLGYMLVLAGLAIPAGAPEPAKAKNVIRALTTPEAQIDVLRQNAFFPVTNAAVPGDLPGAVALAEAAVKAQREAPGAILSLPPVGLGARDGEVGQIFKNCFKEICLDGRPVRQVLDAQARELDRILGELRIPCWRPDPAGNPCRVA